MQDGIQDSPDMERSPAQMLDEAEKQLAQAGVPDPESDARILLFHFLSMDLTDYLMRRDLPLGRQWPPVRQEGSAQERSSGLWKEGAQQEQNDQPKGREKQDPGIWKDRAASFWKAVERRCRRIPLQHIIGTACFMGFDFLVNEHVLIPRPDTEILVETGLAYIASRRKKTGTDCGNRHCGSPEDEFTALRVLDLCTGSGCIAVSIKKMNPQVLCKASDISEEALELALKNAQNLGADVSFVRSDLFDAFGPEEKFDLILSNPPYIPTGVIPGLAPEVALHDPIPALDGGDDGLLFYRLICKEAPCHMEMGGQLSVEIGHDQGTAVSRLFTDMGFAEVSVTKDLAGLDRVVSGIWRSAVNDQSEKRICLTDWKIS